MSTTFAAVTAEAAPAGRSESVVDRIGDVVVSEVEWDAPLPASDAAHPAACDRIGFLRYRLANGPADSSRADAILSWQPGITMDAASQQTLAVNSLHQLADQGKSAEVWSMSRRNNCLEDRTGAVAALANNDPQIAVDYYFKGGSVDGQTYHPPTRAEQAWLSDFGSEQVTEDWYFINSHELPDPAMRKRKLFIGGHSFGGLLANTYARWVFPDGPGWDQIAGDTVFDTFADAEPLHRWIDAVPGVRQLKDVFQNLSYSSAVALIKSGLLPADIGNVLPTGPLGDLLADGGRAIDLDKTTQAFADYQTLMNVAAIGARLRPDAESTLPAAIPHNPGLNLVLSALFTQNPLQLPGSFVSQQTGLDLPTAVAGTDFRDWRLTNMATLGSLYSTSSQPTFFSTQMGTFDGPTVPKYFTVPPQISAIPFLGNTLGAALSFGPTVMPADPTGRLNGWTDTNIEAKADAVDVARNVGSGKLDYTTRYESLRLMVDEFVYIFLGYHGDGFPELLPEDSIDRVPHVAITGRLAGSTYDIGWSDPTHEVKVPDRTHMDTLEGSAEQNDGQPERVSITVADFVTRTLG
ncbi:hypothetical protein AB0N05_27680 [Nocardia sp. NPDC051030]|uniref:hypothetical protein n=1 Tax=Nocardia sp. NPDC051030 TaxID=3155162 RepID=UPI00342EDC44